MQLLHRSVTSDSGNSLWTSFSNYIQQEIIIELLNCRVKILGVMKLTPNALRKLIFHIRDIVQAAVEETEKNIELEQESVKGFLEVEAQKQKNKDLVIKAIAEDVEIRAIESNLINLCESLEIDLTTTDMTGDSTKAHFRSRKKSR